MELKEVVHAPLLPTHAECLLAADIGGTNSNFGFLLPSGDHLVLLLSVHAKSKTVDDFTVLVKQVLECARTKYNITAKYSAFAAAGVVSEQRDFAKPTNANFVIDSKAIIAATGLHCAFVINDFAVIGYGLPHIQPDQLVLVNHGVPRILANKAILGAGTGLGKCIMVWHDLLNRYIPSSSEGGHADFAPQHQSEFDLVRSIRKTRDSSCNISWEDILSGDGIRQIYTFFHDRAHDADHTHHVAPHPDEIFNSRNQDEHAYNTFNWYAKFYARCAKNWALDALALGGIYIAGGIAAKNLALFQEKVFMDEFTNCGKQQELLSTVPVYVIGDYNVSLYGAAAYLMLEKMCK